MKKQLLLIVYLSIASLLQAQVSKTLTVTNPGTLGTLLTATEKTTVQTLTLTGTIDARDFKIMRDSMPALTVIDIKGTSITAYTGTGGTDVIISATYKENTIPQLAFTTIVKYEYFSYPFYYGKNITSITLPESINSIGESAFHGCVSISSIDIPNAVVSIEESAFYSCSLKSITIPSTLQSVGSNAFRYCSKITILDIPVSVKSIGRGAFIGCKLSIDSQNPYFSIVDSVLYNKDKTILIQSFSMSKNFIIPSTVTTIRQYAFIDCPIVSITIPSSVTEIGNSAFYNAYNLKSVTIPSSITKINDSTFTDCQVLQKVIIPSSVTSIGDYAFDGCFLKLKTITIPESVTSLGKYSFGNCSALDSILIPASLKTIGDSAFYYCSRLSKITIPSQSNISSIGNYAFFGCKLLKSFTFPSTLTKIGDYAFIASPIKTISLPSTLTSIGKGAFLSCKIDSVYIPSAVSYIGDSAFLNCPLKALKLSTSLKIIGNNTFLSYVGQSPIYIPASVDSIAPYAFPNGCTLLIDSLNKKYVCIDGVVYNKDTTIVISCSATKKGDYIMPSSVIRISEEAFSTCIGLTSVTLSPKLKTIGRSAFYYDSLITSITIPESVTFIDYSAINSKTMINVADKNQNYLSIDGVLFNKNKTILLQCPSVKTGEYSIPSTITKIGYKAFEGCCKLTYVIIPTSVDSIGYGALGGCTALKSIIIPSSVSFIGSNAFSGCKNVTSIEIPSSITKINSFTFFECKNLTSIEIPLSVTKIGYGAFERCKSLTSIKIPSTVDTINVEAFYNCNSLSTITIPSSITCIESGAFDSCTNLKSIIMLNPQPLDLSLNNSLDYYGYPVAFEQELISKCILFVPAGSKTAYQTAAGWKKFSNIIEGTGISIILSDSIVSFDNKPAVTKTIQITTGSNWTAHSLASWLTVSPSSGNGSETFVLVADSNISSTTRMTMVNIVSKDTSVAPRTIMVVQKGNTKTAIAELNSKALQVFPNPATNSFSIQNTEQAIVSIYSITGALLKTQTVQAGESISINEFSLGLYFVKIQIGEISVTRSLHVLK